MHKTSYKTSLFAFNDYLKTRPFQNYKKKENVNFRFYIKTQYKLRKQAIEIFNQLKAVYNDHAPLYATGARWVAFFKYYT
jgi:hypothetical protein